MQPIPRLGQGSQGGAAGVASLPGGTGGSLIPGLPSLSSIPHIAATPAAIPHLPQAAPSALPAQNTIRPDQMQRAMKVLALVGQGQMETSKAAAILDELNPLEKQTISRKLLNDHAAHGGVAPTDQLRALRVLPGADGTGGAHSATQTVRSAGIGRNLLTDIGNSITGIPAGMALTGKAVAQDMFGIAAGGKLPTHTFNDVAKPMAKSYQQMYSPLVHGDFHKFGQNVEAHPLQPILDASALISGGLGAAGRVASVGDAIRAGQVVDLAGGAQGVAKVGGQYTIQQMKNGRFGVREGNEWISHNLPDKETAVAHAQSLISPLGTNKVTAFAKGGGDRGRLIDRYESKFRPDVHVPGDKVIANDLQKTMELGDQGKLQLGRRSVKQVGSDLKSDLAATFHKDYSKYKTLTSEPGELSSSVSRPLAMARVVGPALYREAMSGIKHGAIYLRPGYLPNNWAGNEFMNLVHQGPLAPVNLAKSFMMTKTLGDQYMAVIDHSLGQNASMALRDGRGTGYISSVMDPLVRVMGAGADQPFRRAAWLHEARRAGYNNLGKVKTLLDRAHAGDESAYMEMAKISRKAQEEVVKFGHLSEKESWVARNLFFVYSWMKGASRYAARYPLQHPIQTNVQAHLSQDVGNPYIKKELGGVPSFLHGVIPVGHDKDGNPILINPFALNPLGTGMQIGQAAAGTVKVLEGKEQFNKFTDSDVTSLMAPLPKAYLTRLTGGKPVATQLSQTIAPVRLIHDLKHPGSGSLFPTSRTEAIGKYTLGSLFPRKANAVALQRTLEREQRSDPVARLATDLTVYKKAFKHDVPQSLVDHYKLDIQQLQAMKDFQHQYAQAHGQSGFRNLPPKNRVEAAVTFLVNTGSITEKEADQITAEVQPMNDTQATEAAANLWSNTGIGLYKRAWDDMMREARGLRDSGMRK